MLAILFSYLIMHMCWSLNACKSCALALLSQFCLSAFA